MDYLQAKKFLDTLPDWEIGRPATGPVEHYLPRTRALLRRMGDPQKNFCSIIVGGTNGKGTVASLISALLSTNGKTGLYTSPHLHTQRERIQVDAQLQSKDDWAEAVTCFYDCTRGFEEEGLGSFSKFEALTVLSTLIFSSAEVDFAVFEVGLGGRYDATNSWDHEFSVLTSISVDHTDVLGKDVLSIAEEKLQIVRPKSVLFTTDSHHVGVAERVFEYCSSNKVAVYVTETEAVRYKTGNDGTDSFEFIPYTIRVKPGENRPTTFVINARLALAASSYLLRDDLDLERAERTISGHRWPGRFETIAQNGNPLIVLDGAHNPAAAAGLAKDLSALSPVWTFVFGVSGSHDSAGILESLMPLVGRMIITSSAHPKACLPEMIADKVLSNIETVVEPSCFRALDIATDGNLPVCITGSLSLVARAREHFQLGHEPEGITEEVAFESIECVEAACRELGLVYESASANGNILRVNYGNKAMYFLRNRHPFNDYSNARIVEDKGYQYELFCAADLPVPFSIQVFNPYAAARFHRYKTHEDISDILNDVESQIRYPLLIKKPRGSISEGVYVERNRNAATRRLENLFKGSGFLDNTLLVQSYVEGVEYRIVASEHELLLAYEKSSDETTGANVNLNPLHHATGRAIKVTNERLLLKMTALTHRISSVIRLGFYAVDVIFNAEGFHVLEVNPNPFCFFYNRSNGRDDFVLIYKQLLSNYMMQK